MTNLRIAFALALALIQIPTGQAAEPFLFATNSYAALSREFILAYNQNDLPQARSLIDFRKTPEAFRHITRLKNFRQLFTNISNVASVDLSHPRPPGDAIWVQIGGSPELPMLPKQPKHFTCTLNDNTNGYMEISFPLLRGIAPTQALMVIIGLYTTDKSLYDRVAEITTDSDR